MHKLAAPRVNNQEEKTSIITLRNQLVAEKAEIIAKSQRVLKHSLDAGLLSENTGDLLDQCESGDVEVISKQCRTNAKRLRNIDQTIQLIDNGEWTGICEECSLEIPFERLRIIPHAKFCVPCQEERNRQKTLIFSVYCRRVDNTYKKEDCHIKA